MASVFSCPGSVALPHWLAYVRNSKALNRKNTDGIGIIAMKRKLKETINPLEFLVV